MGRPGRDFDSLSRPGMGHRTEGKKEKEYTIFCHFFFANEVEILSRAQLILCLVASELSLPVSVQFCCIFAVKLLITSIRS